MPKLWSETIDAHRHAVRDVVTESAAALVMKHGLASVSMSQIAEAAGIGRATLYKYFPDVEAILTSWHERKIHSHLSILNVIARKSGSAEVRLASVLEAYAQMAHQQHGAELATLLHRGVHVVRAHQHLQELIADLIKEGAAAGAIRNDVAPRELALFCLHALTASESLVSKAAVDRLLAVILSGLRSVGKTPRHA
jgi:AcrR family transcriptional regulator